MPSGERPRESIDDLDALLQALPPEIVDAVNALPDRNALIEVVMDLGRSPEARFPDSEVNLLQREITDEDIAFVVDHIGSFGDDNRAGIERTLHRISAIRNRNGKIVGLTCRIGRAVYGTIEIINDFVETGKSILIMGRPGIGKTTMLREAARVLADDMGKRVVVVDTSNEIAGDGDIPHPAIGKARRMQVRTPSMQHEVMIEAVENHMPQVIVIDEIGTELEAAAARTIAERGVQLIGTAHGNNLDNLMLNPTLSDLIGGIQSVTLGDEEARRRRTQKSVLERKAPPTFDVIVEIVDRERVAVHADVADTIDAMLRGDQVSPELRWRDEEGVHRSQGRPRPSPREQLGAERFAGLVGAGSPWRMEPGWRGDGGYRSGGYREAERGSGIRPGYRPGATGGWRSSRGGAGREPATRGPNAEGGWAGATGTLPGERFASPPGGGGRGPASVAEAPFVAGEIADRGPLERGAVLTPAETRAREARELQRQKAWADQASRALKAMKAEDGTGPVNADDLEDDDLDRLPARCRGGSRRRDRARARRLAAADAAGAPPGDQPQAARAGDPGSPTARRHRPRRGRGGCRDDPAQRVQAEDPDASRRGGPGRPDLRPQEQHDPADAVEPDVDLLARDRPARGRPARDRGRHRIGAVLVGGRRAVAAERVHPAAAAPDGRAGEPRLPIARTRAVPAGAAVPGRREKRLALARSMPARATIGVPFRVP